MDTKPDIFSPDKDASSLRQFNACLEQITRFLEEGVLVLDVEGRTAFLNAEGERILGWTSDALFGSIAHFKIHHHNSEQEATPLDMCPMHRSIHDGQVYRVDEDVFIHRDGRLLPVSFVTSPIWSDEHIVGSVTLFKEIGARREMERDIKQAQDIALETARLKAEFLANMSHEIRTPINGVIGMANLLLDSKLNKEQKELATTTRDSAQALLTVANDILDFSRIESGKLEIRSEVFHPLKVVEEVSELLAPQAQKKNINLVVNASNKVPSVLQGDPARIRQVLLNLVGNAVKFTKKGNVTISVRVDRKNKALVVLRFAVADTGIGIPKSAKHRLFQPFTQVDGSSSRPYGGSGLGLSIANRLVELMGGQIGYESRKEKGSLFWFAIPLARVNRGSEADIQSKLTTTRLQGVKILIVDPQQTTQTVLLNQVLRWNMKGTSVESSEEIPAYLNQEASTGLPCDLVLVSSPPGSKQQNEEDLAVARTLTQDPTLPAVHLVLMTDNSDKKYLEEAHRAGYAATLSKPLQRDRLLECLVSLMHPELETLLSDAVRASRTKVSKKPDVPHRTVPVSAHADASAQAVRHAVPKAQGKEQQERPLMIRRPEGGCRILLAEDNAVIQKVAQVQLHRLGYVVHTVANGKEAVESMQTDPCCLVLMDCHMPIMDGYQASQAIRMLSTGQGGVPIIGMVAKTLKGEQERCLEAGMNDVLTKPVQMETLKEMLKQWLPREGDHV